MLLGIAVTVIAMIVLYHRAEKQDLLQESNMSAWPYYEVKEVENL